MSEVSGETVPPLRGVIRSPLHPWNGFTGKPLGALSSSVGTGLRVLLDAGFETFVLPAEWRDFR